MIKESSFLGDNLVMQMYPNQSSRKFSSGLGNEPGHCCFAGTDVTWQSFEHIINEDLLSVQSRIVES